MTTRATEQADKAETQSRYHITEQTFQSGSPNANHGGYRGVRVVSSAILATKTWDCFSASSGEPV